MTFIDIIVLICPYIIVQVDTWGQVPLYYYLFQCLHT